MDPMALAQAALVLLAPYATKGAEAIAAELGKKTLSAAGALLKGLWGRWKDKPTSEAALQHFLQDPAQGREGLGMALAMELASDSALRQELERLLANGPPEAFVRQVVEDADKVLGAEVKEVTGGRLTVDQTAKNVNEITGVRIDKLG
jgi:hypothetical protein